MCYEQRQHIPDNIFSCNAVGIDFYLKKFIFIMFLLILECTIVSDIYVLYTVSCTFCICKYKLWKPFFRGDGSNLMNQNNSV